MVVFFAGSSCRQKPLYGVEYNQEREELDIPLIPDDWRITSITPNETTWRNPDLEGLLKSKTPFHASKYVNYESSKLRYEQDIYFGVEDFIWDGEFLRERISITVYYGESEMGNSFSLEEIDISARYSNENGLMQEISVNNAKEILRSWGLSYP